jgi:integrase
MPKITKRAVDALTPDPERDVFLVDTELKGFGVRMKSSGSAAYFIRYKRPDGSGRRLVIGKVGSMTPDEARKLAREKLNAVAKGADPSAERHAARSAVTVKELCHLYVEAAERGLIMGKRGRPKKASTLSTDRGRIDRHIIPLLGKKPVDEVTQTDINRFLRDVTAGKTAVDEKTGFRGRAIVEGGAGTAARTVGLLGGIFSFAITEGIIPTNPVHGVRRPSDNRRNTRLTPEDYWKLGLALQALAREGDNPKVLTAVWLLALTGCRRGEVENLRWTEVDFDSGCFRLTETKEGASIRPVGVPAFDVLRSLPRDSYQIFVLPGTKPNKAFAGLPKGWIRIAKRADLMHVTPHVLRHSFASTANDLGFTEATISAMLGHSAGSITGRYVHHLDSALIAAADCAARTIHRWMMGEESTPNGQDAAMST